ncbi:acyltransferase family protein [Asticcacaulis sp. 201]|uniref:acyltransferase family protein n=1 Tax=Asticcacaulis sp. 201 TaxID=3028787 RepID=UPI00398395D3
MDVSPPRFVALDVLRGLAVAGMVVVTSPGDWNKTYPMLLHAAWNGWTLADMVFPTFLFAVGMAMGLSFPRALTTTDERQRFWFRVARRVLALVVLGLILAWLYVAAIGAGAWFPGKAGLENIRIPGVPQRIALCYLLAAVLIVFTGRTQADGRRELNPVAIGIAALSILVLYWAAVTFIPVPGYGAGHLDELRSLPAYIDRQIFTPAHLWPQGSAVWAGPVTYDPEGLLSTFPAAVNTLLGVLAGYVLRRFPQKAAVYIGVAGVVLFVAGLLLDPVFVINKRLWTSSFALLSSGVSAVALAGLLWGLRFQVAERVLTPLKVLGANAILVFTLSIVLGMVYTFPLFGSGDHRSSIQGQANTFALGFISDPYLASLACAMAVLVLITAIAWPLYRRSIFLRL